MLSPRIVIAIGCFKSLLPGVLLEGKSIQILLAGLFSVLMANQQAHASNCQADSETVGAGQLFLQKEGFGCMASPQLDTDVSIVVTGTIARVKLEQHFRNPGPDWVEGVYIFPLPENAAVDHLRMRIGERVIEGKIKEKRQAKVIYRAAKKAGKKASLLSQQRPNMFTTSVANIGPKENVTIAIEYQQAVRLDQGQFSLRFPMTLTPRFIPGVAQKINEYTEDDEQRVTTDIVPDGAEISPPFGYRGTDNHPVKISVDLMAGFPVASLHSLYHPVEKIRLNDQHYQVDLRRNRHLSNADFVLEWTALPQTEAITSLYVQEKGNLHYALLMLMPPHGTTPETTTNKNNGLSRDVVFVIDTSGSMAGESIRQAKQALIRAIGQLGSDDRFNIIEFNSQTYALFSHVQPADIDVKSHASSFVRGLEANNGTQMYPAIERALINGTKDQDQVDANNRTRQVVFITDGAVGNEDQLFNLIKGKLGNSRLFTVGIGSAPNSYFMTKAAEFGRGTYTYIAQASEVEPRMDALFRKLQSPVLTDIKIFSSANLQLEFYPRPLPDLYSGEPLLIAMKSNQRPMELTISGRSKGEQDWIRTLVFDRQVGREGVSTLWARRKIDSQMNQYIAIKDPVSKDEKRIEITRLAIDHHLVSRFTSLIAVDKTPERAGQQSLKKHALKNNMPKGSKMGFPQGATSAQLQIYSGLACILLAVLMGWLYTRQQPIHFTGNHG